MICSNQKNVDFYKEEGYFVGDHKLEINNKKIYGEKIWLNLGVLRESQIKKLLPYIKGLTGKKRHIPAFLQKAFMDMVTVLSQVQTPQDFEKAKIPDY